MVGAFIMQFIDLFGLFVERKFTLSGNSYICGIPFVTP